MRLRGCNDRGGVPNFTEAKPDTDAGPHLLQTLPRFKFLENLTMPKRAIKAPDHLAPPTAAWWLSVHEDYELEPHHVRLLTLACEAWDRCGQAREAIDRDGITVPAGDSLKSHPAIAIERDARLAFARLVRELDLDVQAPFERRPPGLRSNRRGA